ncbi:MAG TPA: DUF2723 domain-containing protein [Anaerolineaceae bacterium]
MQRWIGTVRRQADLLAALGVGLAALTLYIRTLAPDLLFGDSAEFQALAYLLGITHTTGYPVYLLSGKIFGTLLPIGTFAYRMNLLSAIFAALTLTGIYLLIRIVTRSRWGAVLGCAVLGLAPSFWSQAVIAEVYTMATVVITWSTYCLFRWLEQPNRQKWLLSCVLILGLGVHTVAELAVPVVGILVLWRLAGLHLPARKWVRPLGLAVLGGAIGAAIFFGAFYLCDRLTNPPASFLNVTLIPSRSLWGATSADLDTFWERVYHTVFSLQWGGALFSGDPAYMAKESGKYFGTLTGRDFSLLGLGLGLLGLGFTLRRKPKFAVYLFLSFLITLFFIVNYKVGSKYVFYLATYIQMAVLIGVGSGVIFETIQIWLLERTPGWTSGAGYVAAVVILTLALLSPRLAEAGDAIKAGKATFFKDDDYTYPLKDLGLPRRTAEDILRIAPQNTLLLMDWRALYAAVYLANVEQDRRDLTFREASPYPSPGRLPDTLVAEVKAALAAGRPVFADNTYQNLRDHFNLRPVPGMSRYIQLLPK